MKVAAATRNNNPMTNDAIPALNIPLLSCLTANISSLEQTTNVNSKEIHNLKAEKNYFYAKMVGMCNLMSCV